MTTAFDIGYFLNIASMRRVTRNPPAMLMVANSVATSATPSDEPSRPWLPRRPPTTMMPLIALVTLISGVCSAGVTFQTTWKPTNTAITNTVRCWSSATVGGLAISAAPLPNRRYAHTRASTRPITAITTPELRDGASAGAPWPCDRDLSATAATGLGTASTVGPGTGFTGTGPD